MSALSLPISAPRKTCASFKRVTPAPELSSIASLQLKRFTPPKNWSKKYSIEASSLCAAPPKYAGVLETDEVNASVAGEGLIVRTFWHMFFRALRT